MKQLTDISEYNGIIERYCQKGVLSNDYLQLTADGLIKQGALFSDCHDRNAFLFVKKDVGMRMYYYINDMEERADFSACQDLVVEILFRGKLPQAELGYLSRVGFRLNVVRDQYTGTYGELGGNISLVPGVQVEKAQTILEIQEACELFNESFDRLSGDFISEREYRNLLDSGSILIAKDTYNTSFLGALHQVKEGSVNVIGHLAVMRRARGQGIGKALLDAFVELNKNPENAEKTRYKLWVQRQNGAAVSMYLSKGFKLGNKSTISLIR